MNELAGRVAVVTGAASGIGLGIARALAHCGARLVLADIEEPALRAARSELEATGCEVISVHGNVAERTSVERLADEAHRAFGKVHILCNNAGVSGGGGNTWEATPNDWTWVMGVNLMGVVHCLRAFVPRMLAHGEEGHIVHTSSILGMTTGAGSIYAVSKHALTRLTEGLYIDLHGQGANIGVSLLCPGPIATRIAQSDRNRTPELVNHGGEPDPGSSELRQRMDQYFQEHGMSPERVGRITVEAIRARRFYVWTHPELNANIERRMRGILCDGVPLAAPSLMPQAASDERKTR